MPRDWRAYFEAFAAEKTRSAAAAVLPPYVTDLLAAPHGAIAIGNAWSMRLFDGPFYLSRSPRNRPACSLVFVQSADGNTGARDPSTLRGGDTDKHLVYEGLSRVAADAVLAGAETVRGGDVIFSVWHPELVALRASLGQPRHPAQIVATLRGMDLDAGLLFNVPDVRVILVTDRPAAAQMTDGVRARPWVTLVTMNGAAELAAAFAGLRSMGIERVSCVGGRTLATQMLDADLVDDVFLTTSPSPGGQPGTPLSSRPWRDTVVARKHGTGVETGIVFEHVLPRKYKSPEQGDVVVP